jgi:hypothetical protein
MKTRYFIVALLFAFVQLCFTSCKKEEANPLEGVSGVYTGSVAEGATIYSNIQANVTVAKDVSNGEWFIESIGFTAPTYQLVLTRSASNAPFTGSRSGSSFTVTRYDVAVSDGTLNVKGVKGSNPATQVSFNFTGRKQ